MKNNKYLIFSLLTVIIICGISLAVVSAQKDNLVVDKVKKEIKKQGNKFIDTKTLEDKYKESWYKNKPETRIIKTFSKILDKEEGDAEFISVYLEDNYIKIAVVNAIVSKGQIDFILGNNIVTEGQKLIDFKYITLKGENESSLLIHVVTEDGLHYLSIYGSNKDELLRVGGNGGIMVRDLNGDKIPEIIPITKTGETKESSIINIYQYSNNHFVEVDAKKYIAKDFSTQENIIKHLFRVLRQGNENLIKGCFSKEVQRNFSDNDFTLLATLYKDNAFLLNQSLDYSNNHRITVYYKSKITRGNINFNLIQEKGKWLINDVPTELIPGKTKFNG